MPQKKANQRRRRKQIRQLRRLAALACVALLLVACGILATQIVEEKQRAAKLDSLQNLYGGSSAYAEGENAPAQPEATPVPAVQEDFAALYEQNPHLIAWLDAGSTISLPVVQYDNEYYLDHDFYGRSDAAGTVFLNAANRLWPQDEHLLIHGHNMKDGSMFATLTKYREEDWLRENPIIYLRTIYDEEPTAYVVLSVFDASMNEGAEGYFNLGRIRFDSDEAFLGFCRELGEVSLYDVPVDAQSGDCLLSLVTCSYFHENGRLTVVCRKLRDGETVEDVTALMQQAVKR